MFCSFETALEVEGSSVEGGPISVPVPVSRAQIMGPRVSLVMSISSGKRAP